MRKLLRDRLCVGCDCTLDGTMLCVRGLCIGCDCVLFVFGLLGVVFGSDCALGVFGIFLMSVQHVLS